jgi:hypothetical protein
MSINSFDARYVAPSNAAIAGTQTPDPAFVELSGCNSWDEPMNEWPRNAVGNDSQDRIRRLYTPRNRERMARFGPRASIRVADTLYAPKLPGNS